MAESCFVRSLGLCEVSELLEKHTDLQKSIDLSAHSEVAREDRVLEVPNGLVELVGLSKNNAELVKYFRLLIKVRRHF
jgi:hypothetical protein